MTAPDGEFNSAISTDVMVKLASIVNLLLVVGIFCVTLRPVSAYLDIALDSFKQLSDTSLVDWTTLKVKRVKKERKLFGNMTFHIDLPNSVLVEIKLFKKQGGEYRLQPYRIPSQGSCDFLKSDIYFYQEMTQFSDLPYPAPCPYPKGTYEFHGYSPTFKNVPLVVMTTGDYMVETVVQDGTVGCTEIGCKEISCENSEIRCMKQ